MTTEKLLSIGQLAKVSGVPVKTIRHYSDIGVLPPSVVTGANYRFYSGEDRLRLELIRTLRTLDFDLDSIGKLLAGRKDARALMELQLEAVERAAKNLGRMRVVLRAALKRGDDEPLAHVQRLDALTKLAAVEREGLLRTALEKPLRGVPVEKSFMDRLLDSAFAGIPEALDEVQLEALTELWSLLHDEDFLAKLRAQADSWWSRNRAPRDPHEHTRLILAAAGLADAGHSPSSREVQEVVDAYLGMQARSHGKRVSARLRAEILAALDAHDPRAVRFWELVGILHGWPAPSPHAKGMALIIAGLRTA